MTNPDGGYRLPEEVDPQRIQFCIEIPNDLHHIIAFWGALEELTWAKNWAWDGLYTGKAVALVWQDVIAKARASFEAGECASEELCQDYRPTSARITWFPESPYNPNDFVPDGYTYHPYTIVDNSILGTIIGMWGLGYKVGDVYTDLTKLPVMSSWEDVFENLGNMPSFTISGITGTGTVKLHFLNIPQGGRALIQVDGAFDLLNLQLIELNKDLVSVPQETQVPIVIEVPIESDGEHTVKVSFLPTVDDTFIPVFFGGGFRGFELCGFGREGCDDMSDECCGETNNLLTTNNSLLQKLVDMIGSGFKIVPVSAGFPSDAVAGDCAPQSFDSDPDDSGDDIALRAIALCYVIHCYITEILYKACLQVGIPSTVLDLIFPEHLTMPPALHRINVDYPPQLSLVALIENLASSGEFSDLVTCMMLNNLRGKMNIFTTFKASVTTFGGFGSIVVPISTLVAYTNRGIENWHIFNDALDEAMEMESEVEGYTCPCEVDCSEPLQLVIVDGRGTLELVEGYTDLYHFTGDATSFDGVNYHGGVYVRDALGRCLSVWNSSEVGMETQPVLYHHVIGCCGTESTTGLLGGFAGLTEDTKFFTQFYWDQQSSPVETWYHVKCIDDCPEE